MRTIIFSYLSLFANLTLNGQIQPIDVAELTIKIGSMTSEELFYGFAEGDKIIFSLEEINGKELKEFQIVELPNNARFLDFKTVKLENKSLTLNRQGVYMFKFTNSAIATRVCKLKIQRIPISQELVSFNTNWEWKNIYDTTYTPYTQDSLIGYETTYVNKVRKDLVKVDTIVSELFNKTERVHSETAIGKTQYANLNVNLPSNTYLPNKENPYQSTEVVSWSYWIGVGQKAMEEYEKSNKRTSGGITALGAMTGYGALASLAVTGLSMFSTPSVGDNVQYKFLTVQNGVNKLFDSGNGISASGRNTNLLQGGFTIQLFNDNYMEGIDVNVKLVCVQVSKKWEDVQFTEKVVTPQYITLNKMRTIVKMSRIRVNAQ